MSADPGVGIERFSTPWERTERFLVEITRELTALGPGAVILLLVVAASIAGHFVLTDPTAQDLAATLQPPSGAHLAGTDDLGRDVLSRILAATLLDLSLGLGITVVAGSLGVLTGTVAGYFGGWVERVIMRIADVMIAFPFMVSALAILAVMGAGIASIYVALVSVDWPFYARFGRAEMLALREKAFVQAAQGLGYSHSRIIIRHALPNLLRPCAVYAMADIVINIVSVAALSYLGLGVAPPIPEWGSIISEGQGYLLSAWWITTLGGAAVAIVGVGFTLMGDRLSIRLGTRREFGRLGRRLR